MQASQDGYLLIACPNHEARDRSYYNEYWAAYDVPRHLYHFDKESFHNLIRQLGLKIVDTHPMKLDAYYVSLLSEKYKKLLKKEHNLSSSQQDIIDNFIEQYNEDNKALIDDLINKTELMLLNNSK